LEMENNVTRNIGWYAKSTKLWIFGPIWSKLNFHNISNSIMEKMSKYQQYVDFYQ
jgi:hypothetical protein